MTERIKVAIVGAGRIGMVHLRNICSNPRLTLKYVVDVSDKHAIAGAKIAVGSEAIYPDDKEDLITKLKNKVLTQVKGIVICTPTAQHREIILAAIAAGVHIMCEKPISLKVKEIDECYTAAKNKVILLCGYQRRSDPSFVQLQNDARNNKIGTLQIVKTISRDNPVPTMEYLAISGGIFHDCGSHDIDVCRWILGENPNQVFAFAHAFDKRIGDIGKENGIGGDFDTVLITLKFPSGALANIDLSRKAAYGYDQRIEVLGDKGMLQSQNRPKTTTVLSTEHGVNGDTNCFSFPQRYEHAYALELDHFADLIENPKLVPRISHEDARNVAIIADAAEESARLGTMVTIKY